ncbi:MAG TPA: TetR family transcriptional regulator [Bacteroidetes bacterium]|nr:TetR family transcriptional regulator [Bacteroidota bacterium]
MTTRENILNAANNIILENRLEGFTLDAVAKKANVSKGGLLYHFPSKNALIEGLIDSLFLQFKNNMNERLNTNKDISAKDWMKAFITERFENVHIDPDYTIGLLATSTMNKDLLLPVIQQYSQWQNQFEKTDDPVLATIIRLVTDGLILTEVFLGIRTMSDEMREKVYLRLSTSIDEMDSDNVKNDFNINNM